MPYLRFTFILFLPFLFSSCTTIAENMGWTGLIVLSVILLSLFALMFYFIFKRKRQADKSLAQFDLSVQQMLGKLDSAKKRIKSLEVLVKRINEDKKYEKDTAWRDQVLAKTYLHLASQYFNMNDRKKTLEYCNKILQLTPDDAMTLYNRGSIYSGMGDHEKALADLSRSIELVPNYPSSYNNRGMVLYRLGRYDEALTDFDEALGQEESAVSYYNRALVYHELKKYEPASIDYDRALALCGEDDRELRNEILQAKNKISGDL